MKKRILKKLVKRGVCPVCRSQWGMSCFTFGWKKRVANYCFDCGALCDIFGYMIKEPYND